MNESARQHDSRPTTSSEQQSQGLWRLRSRIVRTLAKRLLLESRLRITLVIALSLVFWFGIYWLFYDGYQFLAEHAGTESGIYLQTISAIYNVFFASLMVMLVISSAIIVYGGIYRSSETQLLLTLPIFDDRIVLYKFQESLLFSSWGFVLLGSPMLVAYGVVSHAPWYYYPLLAPFLGAFAYIPCAAGAIGCFLIVHRVPQMRMRLLAVLLTGMLFASLAGVWLVLGNQENDILTAEWFHETIARLQYSEHRLLPSWWLTSGLLESARRPSITQVTHPVVEGMKFLVLLLTNAMLAHVVLLRVGGRVLRSSYSGMKTLPARGKRPRPGWLETLILARAPFMSRAMRLLLVKDLRVFRRDPLQWSQFLIFFGLLALYFVNIRRLTYDANYAAWVNMISFLNLAVVGLILSTFTTRFIFPMISLEGNRFWILGLLPVDRDTILWGKFVFAALGSMIPSTILILLSDIMLGIPWFILAVHQLICVLLCLGLSGIAVGLGARMPDLRERSPAKIAAGFGGTLNLVLSAAFIVAEVMLTALPCHFYIAAKNAELGNSALAQFPLETWIAVGAAAALVLGVAATWIPMRMGLRAFRAMEF